MKTISPDFKSLLTENYLKDMAEHHIECWKDRYFRKSKSDIKFDLQSHDDSLELELITEDLGRELTDKEQDKAIKEFHKAVVKHIY